MNARTVSVAGAWGPGLVLTILLLAACTAAEPTARRVVFSPTPAPTSEPAPAEPDAAPAEAPPPPQPTPDPEPTPPPTLEVPYSVDVRVPDGDDFAPLLAATMSDPRGWIRAGYVLYEDPGAPYTVVLAEGDEVDELCLPYETGGRFSCQNGPVVAINADRWRHAVEGWPLDLTAYRVMLLNHEMGHLVGQRHVPCTPGEHAPVMYQQSGGLGECLANPWPLEAEIETAARHDQPIAPGYGE